MHPSQAAQRRRPRSCRFIAMLAPRSGPARVLDQPRTLLRTIVATFLPRSLSIRPSLSHPGKDQQVFRRIANPTPCRAGGSSVAPRCLREAEVSRCRDGSRDFLGCDLCLTQRRSASAGTRAPCRRGRSRVATPAVFSRRHSFCFIARVSYSASTMSAAGRPKVFGKDWRDARVRRAARSRSRSGNTTRGPRGARGIRWNARPWIQVGSRPAIDAHRIVRIRRNAS